MIFLFTGLPGAGKTLNAIKFVLEDDRFRDRPIYYNNIQRLAIDGWQELSTDEAKRWYDLPEKSLVILDECQSIFPPRRQGVDVPESVARLSTHRHRGFDLILISQHPMLLDNAVRRLIGTHRHYDRPFGLQRFRCLEWQAVANDPSDYHAGKEAVVTGGKLDKAIFSRYHSAEVHTHKRRIPKKIYLAVALLLSVISGFGFFAYRMRHGVSAFSDTSATAGSETVAAGPIGLQSGHSAGHVMTRAEYLLARTPRIAGLAYTAPLYDSVRSPVTYPWPSCVLNNSTHECRCYSQQGTRMQVPHTMCVQMVRHGLFDNARAPSTDTDTGGGGGPDAGSAALATAPISPPEPLAFLPSAPSAL